MVLRNGGSRAWSVLRPALRALERVVWGGPRRGRLFERLLAGHYMSIYRRRWMLANPGEQPHFFDHRVGAALLTAGEGNPYGWFRAFFVAELLRPGDRVLDIGCGDGFFDRRFFSERCRSIDAIDIEPSAIAHATRHNGAPNISYRLLDAVNDDFPHPPYDIVVWDGALGHFARGDTDSMLDKIRASLAPGGLFAGSESLGIEGHDHLQFFESLDDLGSLLGAHFPHVALRRIEYSPSRRTPPREEAYWRCADDPVRLTEAAWRPSP
jgi:SAM-dependent methyltransferase